MKKIIFVFSCLIMMMSCAKDNGVYQADKGWDCVYNGQIYRYRCEPDGVHLYTSFDSGNENSIVLVHKMDGNRVAESSWMRFRFLCVNNDNDYEYIAEYKYVEDYYGQKIKSVICEINDTIGFISMRDIKALTLLEKYLKR